MPALRSATTAASAVREARGNESRDERLQEPAKACQRQKHDLRESRNAGPEFIPPDAIFQLHRAFDLQLPKEREVRSAVLADVALPLFVPALGAFMNQDRMARNAEFSSVWICVAAFGALHRNPSLSIARGTLAQAGKSPRLPAFARSSEQLAYQRNSHVEREQQYILQQV
jgi:hypothetical protein